MTPIRNIIDVRKIEVSDLYNLLDDLEKGSIFLSNGVARINFPTGVKTVNKSCIVVMLYNVVESVVTAILKKIHNEIIYNNVDYKDLNRDIKCISLLYFNTAISKKGDFSNAVDFAHDLIQMLFLGQKFNLNFDDMEKHYHLYSGNLDSRKISDVFSKYGLSLNVKLSELKTIKDARNSLAHGNYSFEEYGRDLTIQKIKIMIDRVFEYLNSLVDQVEIFLNEKKYMIC